MRTLELVSEEREAIVAAAEADGDRPLTDKEIASYKLLEKEAESIQASNDVKERQKAWSKPNLSIIGKVTGGVKGDEVLEQAFKHYLMTGRPNADIADRAVVAKKNLGPGMERYATAQVEGTTTAGGYLVPPGFRQVLVERLKKFGGVRTNAENITTDTGNSLKFPYNDDVSNEGEVVAEGGATASGADLTVGIIELGAYNYRTGGADNQGIKASIELIQDSAFDVASFVARKAGTRIGRKQAVHLVMGNGSGQPLGINMAKVPDMNLATSNPFTYAKLKQLEHLLDPAYRELGAKWYMNDKSVGLIEQVLDTTGRPLIIPLTQGIEGGVQLKTLFGYEVVIDQAFPDVANASAAEPGLAGDAFVIFGCLDESYIIRNVAGISVLADPFTLSANGLIAYHAFARMDANVKDPNGFVSLAGYHA